MNFTDISVIIIFIIFILSGYIINFARGEKPENIQYTKDKKSLLWFRILVPVGLVLSEIFYFSGFGVFANSTILIIIGWIFVVLGLITRWFAVLTLGKEFNVSLTIIKNHELKTKGIYKYIRHPSYTALLVYYLGLAIIMQNIFSFIVLIILPLTAVINRIKIEEDMLLEYFKEDYTKYCKKTKKLLPLIY